MVEDVPEDEALDSKRREDDEEYNDALDYLGVDKKTVDDEAFVNFKVDKEVSKKVTKLTQLAMSYRMTLEGKSYDEEKGGYKQTGKAMAGQRFIAKTYAVLNSYASEANLLTQKDIETFVMQYWDACRKVFNESLRDRSISERNQRVILKIFKDTLFNIGEIITGSKDNMAKVFGRIEEEKKEEEWGKF